MWNVCLKLVEPYPAALFFRSPIFAVRSSHPDARHVGIDTRPFVFFLCDFVSAATPKQASASASASVRAKEEEKIPFSQ